MENSTYNRPILQKGFLSLLMVLFCLVARAQPSDALKGLAADTLVFTSVQHPPEFEGGMNEFYKFLGTNLRYPVNARTHHVQGRVILSMIVEKDGSISHTKVIRGVT
ncbi:MAG: energy transducer TonB, partial [Mucilaginibacter sp.]